MHERLSSLPAPVRNAALLTVAASHPTRTLVEQAAGADALAEALGLGILEPEGPRVRAAHPLLASVLYGTTPHWERRHAHRVLADSVDDPEEHARHLALSAVKPDETIAGELERAAGLAAGRGAPGAAASLAEHAVRLTPAQHGDDLRRRSRTAAHHHYAAGDQARSTAILSALVAGLEPGPERARILADLSQSVPSQLECLELCRRGIDEAGDDARLGSELHFLAAASARRATTLAEAAEHAQAASLAAAEAGDDGLRARAMAMLGHLEALRGGAGGIARLELAAEIEGSLEAPPLHFRPSFLLGITLLYLGEFDRARPLIEAQYERADDRGDEVMRGVALSTLAELELRAGNWLQAQRCAYDGASLQEQAAPLQDQAHHVLRAGTSRRTSRADGRGPRDRRAASRTRPAPRRPHGRDLGPPRPRLHRAVAGESRGGRRAARTGGAPARGDGHRPLRSATARAGLRRGPGLTRRPERAEAANTMLEGSTEVWDRALAARGRALIAAAARRRSGRGRGDRGCARAPRAARRAVRARPDAPRSGVDRTEDEARGDGEGGADPRAGALRQLGAPLWADKAAAELARLPGGAPRDDELSETQRQIAQLVAVGLSNKEIAARLFITARTVEANLSKIYEQLGVRSRTELASRLAAGS